MPDDLLGTQAVPQSSLVQQHMLLPELGTRGILEQWRTPFCAECRYLKKQLFEWIVSTFPYFKEK